VESGPIPSRGSQESCQLTQESSESSCPQHSKKESSLLTQVSSEGRCPQHSSRRAVCSLKSRQKAAVYSTPSREHSAQGFARNTPVKSPCWQSVFAQDTLVVESLEKSLLAKVPLKVPRLVPVKSLCWKRVPVGKGPIEKSPCWQTPWLKRPCW
jgi:hypothetical protein